MAAKKASRVALILLVQLLLLVDERVAQSEKNCRCVEKHQCNKPGSTDVVVLPTSITPANAGDIGLRFDENNCESLHICCEENDITHERLTSMITFDRCGVRHQNGIGYRLTGDKIGVSEYGEFPWTLMVLIDQQVVYITRQVYQCAASLIAPNLALTAAHCVKQPEKYSVRAGEWDTSTDKERFQTQTRTVAQVIIHEKYNQLHHNNIALLKLDKPFDADENIQAVCLPPPDANFNGMECFTGAWGKDKFEDGRLQNILRRVEVPVVPHGKCQDAFRSTRLGPFFVLDKSYMCAGGEENVNVCTGDAGAPLVCPISKGNDRYFQAGIVAWGIGCGQKGIPGAYTDVTKFVAWINDKMAALGVDASVSRDNNTERLTSMITFDRCGVRHQNGIGYRLTGDKIGVSEYGEFPWTLMVLIDQQVVYITRQVYQCAASLIAPNLALTAAHCVKQPEKYSVRAGEWDTSTDKERFQTQTRTVAQVIIHEKYNQLHHNNIALLKLDKPFDADENIQAVCLPPPDANFNGMECFTGAWGKDKFEDGRLQNILRRVEVPVVPHGKCQDAFRSTRLGPFFVLDKSYMCAGGEENVNVCTGDAGAPLVCPISKGNDRYFQAGIVAWGIGCGQKGIPGAYTDVTKFVAWINDKMAALGVDASVSRYSLL